jgi:enolase
MKIKTITPRQVFDSRGFPTVECDVILQDGSLGRAIVPSGASTGSGEAVELRDGGSAWNGKGVSKALTSITTIITPALVGSEAEDQRAIDDRLRELDGTADKSHLGANALLAVSLATARAAAAAHKLPLYAYVGELAGNKTYRLPMPMLNILNGGKHASGSTDIQEFMIIPTGAGDFMEAMRYSSEIYHALGTVLATKGYLTTVGDEGGYAPAVQSGSDEALELIAKAVEMAGYQLGEDVALALDVAASELGDSNGYDFSREGRRYTAEELIERYKQLRSRYPLLSIEDGLGETDWGGWQQLTSALGTTTQLVGDDLLVTNTELLRRAIDSKSANAILIKPNQIGTLSETIAAVSMAQQAGWNTVMSHRSGETEDTTIAHLSVGLNTGQIKTGSFARSDRIAKYNELVRIAELLDEPQLANPFNER